MTAPFVCFSYEAIWWGSIQTAVCFNCREFHDSLFNALNLQNRNFRFRSKFFDFIDLKFVRPKFRHTNFKTMNFVVFQIFRRAENCAYRFLYRKYLYYRILGRYKKEFRVQSEIFRLQIQGIKERIVKFTTVKTYGNQSENFGVVDKLPTKFVVTKIMDISPYEIRTALFKCPQSGRSNR